MAHTAKKVLVLDHSTPAHGFVHVSRALKHASKSLDLDFPSCEDLDSVHSNLAAVMLELVEVEKHLSAANRILSKLYNEEKQPTQWGAQYNESSMLLFKKDNANRQAFLNMLSESQAVKSTVSLYRESLRFNRVLTTEMQKVAVGHRRLESDFIVTEEEVEGGEEALLQDQQHLLETPPLPSNPTTSAPS